MRTTLAIAALSTALVVTGAPLPHASGGDAIIRTGSCSGSADWKLKAKHDNGRIEAEWEIDSNRSGQTWRVRIRDVRRTLSRGRELQVRAQADRQARRHVSEA